jgi:hypothetical protein
MLLTGPVMSELTLKDILNMKQKLDEQATDEQGRYLILSTAEYKSLKIALGASDLPMIAGASIIVRSPNGTVTNMNPPKEI